MSAQRLRANSCAMWAFPDEHCFFAQLYEVGEMRQYFTLKVTHPLSASSTQTYVGARYLRHGDTIWELPTTRYLEGMLNEHGMKEAKHVVTPAVNRNDDDDDDEEEASAEEHRILRRIVGTSQFLPPCPRTGRSTPPQAAC